MNTHPQPFDSLLIANRGEIACRIIRTAKALGLRTIAVYSEADKTAPHVQMADDAFALGPAPVADSYLNISRLIEAIKTTNAGAVHPGYGFVSENAAFAKACAEAGAVFIGPSPDAIDLMGDKAKAKRRMIEAGVPCVPGYQGEGQDDETLIAEAARIGFPIMVKAAAGGGGRGMRLVSDGKDLPGALKTARSEAENAFGSGDLILERAIIKPRHVEIQVFADAHGNVIHLGERDCSVQRRHQKVLEEAPGPSMTPALRDAMGAAAVKAAKDISYVGAGTVEFLLAENGEFYFLEMNTRLQVEHPVTEMITGLDLVALQIGVAQGQPLRLSQDDVALNGHAIEARLYAEDTSADFLPAAGPIDLWAPSRNARIDAGIETGGEVSSFYDPMLAKVIAHGATREEARRKLVRALKETTLFGVANNKRFLIDTLEKPAFAAGDATTAFIAENFAAEDLSPAPLREKTAAIGAVLLYKASQRAAMAASTGVPETLLGWSSASRIATPYRFTGSDEEIIASLEPANSDALTVTVNDAAINIRVPTFSDHNAQLIVDGKRMSVQFNCPPTAPSFSRIQFTIDGNDFDLTNLNGVYASASDAAGAGAVVAPMHGMVVDVFVAPGGAVKKGDKLMVLEAMKMQHELTAEIDGVVGEILAAPGAQVAADTLLVSIDAKTE